MAPKYTLDSTQPDEVYQAAINEIAEIQGVINLAEARLVDVTRAAMDRGVAGGDNLPPAKWMAWRAGVSPAKAHDIVRLAKRSHELPHTMAAVRAGKLTVDQAAVIARYVPVRYEQSAAEVAQACTVRQLHQALPWYRDTKPTDNTPEDERRSVATGIDDHGWWGRFRLSEAEGAIVDQALKAMVEDLRRQAKADAAASGTDPVPVYAADALVALAETALRAGEAARPGTDRYLVHAHLHAGPAGLQLMTHLGIILPDGQRRQILCDTRLRGIVHDDITPVGIGRTTRLINRRLRRIIEHRDGGCAVPGCGSTTNLDIHHICHWEDGGPTEPSNLITLCRYHHTCHHNGTLDIEGNADHPRHTAPGVIFTNQRGHQLDPTGTPITPHDPTARPTTPNTPSAAANAAAATLGIKPHTYQAPDGGRLDRWAFHLNEDPNHPSTHEPNGGGQGPKSDPPPDEPDPIGATNSGSGATHPHHPTAGPTGPDSPTTTDPTRAGPHH